MDSDLVALPRLLGLLAVRLQRHLHLGVNVNLKVSRFLHLQPVLPAANCLGVDRHGAAHGRHHENPHDTDHKTITGVENVGLCKCAQFLGRWSTAAGGAWLCARRAGGGGAWRLERWADCWWWPPLVATLPRSKPHSAGSRTQGAGARRQR